MSADVNHSKMPVNSEANPCAASVEQLKAAAAVLEAAAANRALLAALTVEERTRLLTAAGEIYCPDLKERRRLVKARIKTVPLKQWVVGRELRKRIRKAFDRQGIEIPFPGRLATVQAQPDDRGTEAPPQ